MDDKDFILLCHPREKIKKLKIRPDDLISITYPKSGTNWIKHIIRLLLNDGSVDDSKAIPEETRGGHLEFLAAGEDDHPSTYAFKKLGHPDFCVNMETMKSPRYFATHMKIDWLPDNLPKSKIIYLARNPKDVCVSLFFLIRCLAMDHTVEKDRDLFGQTVDGFINGTLPMEHGRWDEHVLSWWQRRNEDNILFLKYEDMRRDLRTSVQKISEFIGKNLSPELIDKIVHLATFETMKKKPPPDHELLGKAINLNFEPGESVFIRKGKVGGWKDYFTVAQNEYFDEHYKKWMEGSGLDFDFE
ncbi:sulfotransferase 1E1-like [Glandiceps talaboti]